MLESDDVPFVCHNHRNIARGHFFRDRRLLTCTEAKPTEAIVWAGPGLCVLITSNYRAQYRVGCVAGQSIVCVNSFFEMSVEHCYNDLWTVSPPALVSSHALILISRTMPWSLPSTSSSLPRTGSRRAQGRYSRRDFRRSLEAGT